MTEKDYSQENAIQIAEKHVPDEIIIKFKDVTDAPGQEERLLKAIERIKKIGFVKTLGVYVVKVEDLDRNPHAIMNRLKNHPLIEYVEPNYTMEICTTDARYKDQASALKIINAQAGWEITTGKGSPPIAVIDTGVAKHDDLPEPVCGYSVTDQDYSVDTVGHGTCVAGVIGAIGDNGIGIAGINWNASIMPVKVDDTTGTMTTTKVAEGIIWAADNGAKVINLSLGSPSDSNTKQYAIDYAYKKGCAIFAASGNEGVNGVYYPARYDNVMAVGATDNGASRTSFSNYGVGLDVVGVGSRMTTTAPSGGYSSMSGTSFAAPQAAGLASLILAIRPTSTPDEIYGFIRQGAKPLNGGYNEQTGYGVIDVGKTLQLAAASAGYVIPEQPAKTSLIGVIINAIKALFYMFVRKP